MPQNKPQSIPGNISQGIPQSMSQNMPIMQPAQETPKPVRKKAKRPVIYAFVAVLTALAVTVTAITQPWKYIGGNGKDEIKLIEVSGTKEVNQTFDFGLKIHRLLIMYQGIAASRIRIIMPKICQIWLSMQPYWIL